LTDEADGSATTGAGLSLRDAVIAANASSLSELVINLQEGTYALDITGINQDATQGDLNIAAGKTIKIVGAGQDKTIIDASTLGDRIFNIGGGATLDLSGVTLRGGGFQNTDPTTIFTNPFNGGAILNFGGTLKLNNSTVTGNKADNGGGIFIGAGQGTVTNTIVSNNSTSFDGGGISTLFGGSLTLADSTITNNTAARNAGGLGFAFGGSGTVTNSQMTDNKALGTFNTGNVTTPGLPTTGLPTYGIGGGIHLNDGTLTVTGGSITGNSAATNGGGVISYLAATTNPAANNQALPPGTLTVSPSTVIQNNTPADSPTFAQETNELTVDDTVASDAPVGTPITVTDPNPGDTITYSLTSDDNDPNKNGNAAFIINTSTGQLKVGDAADLPLQDVFNLSITAKDSTGLTDTTTAKVTVKHLEQTTTPGIFTISSLSIKNLQVLVQNNVNINIGLFLVDGPDGSITVGGTTYKPGDTDYSKEAVKRSLSLLSALTGSKDFAPGQLKKVLNLKDAASLVSASQSSNLYFGFLSVSDGTLGSLAQGSGTALLSTDTSKFTVTLNSDGSYQFTVGSSSFSFQLTSETPALDEPVGLNVKIGDTTEIVTAVISDLTGQPTGTYTVTASVSREAAFDNILGFFAVDRNGTVLKVDGSSTNVSLANTDEYRNAIADNLINPNNLIKVSNGAKDQKFKFDLDLKVVQNTGFQILPVLGVQVGSFKEKPNANIFGSAIYYPILGINSDKFDRMVAQGSIGGQRVYGFEDLPNGTLNDKDFNDFTVKIQVSV
jgi:hypothetical protein